MSVTVVPDGLEGWQRAKPPDLSLRRFSTLHPDTGALTDTYLQAIVIAMRNKHRYKDTWIMVVILKDDVCEDDSAEENDNDNGKTPSADQLAMFMIGEDIIDTWTSCVEPGDHVCLTDVNIELAPNDKCHVAFEETDHRFPKAWVMKQRTEEEGEDLPAPPKVDALAAVPPKQCRDYTYTALKDMHPGNVANTWGVVRFFREPAKSKGSDYSTFITITDPSFGRTDNRLACLLFAREESQLPPINSLGVIVRFHRLRVALFNNQKQGRSGPGFAWLLFDPTSDSGEPMDASSTSYTMTEQDKTKLRELRDWLHSDECPEQMRRERATVTPTKVTTTSSPAKAPSESTAPCPTSPPPKASSTCPPSPAPLPSCSSPGPSTLISPSSPSLPPPASPEPGTSGAQVGQGQVRALDQPTLVTYSRLCDVKIGARVNVIGVITFILPPKSSRRGRGVEFYRTVTISDPNRPASGNLKCMLFNIEKSKLLGQAIIGQIVVLHNLKVSSFEGCPQGQRGPDFRWAVYDSIPPGPIKQVYASDNWPGLDYNAEKKLVHVRDWAADEDLLLCRKINRVCDVKPNTFFEFVGQVVETYVAEPNICKVLRVWDGTAPILSIYESEFREENSDRLIDNRLHGLATGHMVDIFVFDNHFPTAHDIEPGDFVLFTNLHAFVNKSNEPDDGDELFVRPIELCLHGGYSFGRSLRRLDPQVDPIARHLQQELLERAASIEASKLSQKEDSSEEEGENWESREKNCATQNKGRHSSERSENGGISGQDPSNTLNRSSPERNLQNVRQEEHSTRSSLQQSSAVVESDEVEHVSKPSPNTQSDSDRTVKQTSKSSSRKSSNFDIREEVATKSAEREFISSRSSIMSAESEEVIEEFVSSRRSSDCDRTKELPTKSSSRRLNSVERSKELISKHSSHGRSGRAVEEAANSPSRSSSEDDISEDGASMSYSRRRSENGRTRVETKKISSKTSDFFDQAQELATKSSRISSQFFDQAQELVSRSSSQSRPNYDNTEENIPLRSSGRRKSNSKHIADKGATRSVARKVSESVGGEKGKQREKRKKLSVESNDSNSSDSDGSGTSAKRAKRDSPTLNDSSSTRHVSFARPETTPLSISQPSLRVHGGRLNPDAPRKHDPNQRCSLQARTEVPKRSATRTLGMSTELVPVEELLYMTPPYKCRVRVRLAAFYPKLADVRELLCHHCQTCDLHLNLDEHPHNDLDVSYCPQCRKSGCQNEMKAIIRLKLILVDDTAWIEGLLHGAEASHFLPFRFEPEPPHIEELYRILGILCPEKDDIGIYPARPWMECCVISYVIGTETFFQVFNTQLVEKELEAPWEEEGEGEEEEEEGEGEGEGKEEED